MGAAQSGKEQKPTDLDVGVGNPSAPSMFQQIATKARAHVLDVLLTAETVGSSVGVKLLQNKAVELARPRALESLGERLVRLVELVEGHERKVADLENSAPAHRLEALKSITPSPGNFECLKSRMDGLVGAAYWLLQHSPPSSFAGSFKQVNLALREAEEGLRDATAGIVAPANRDAGEVYPYIQYGIPSQKLLSELEELVGARVEELVTQHHVRQAARAADSLGLEAEVTLNLNANRVSYSFKGIKFVRAPSSFAERPKEFVALEATLSARAVPEVRLEEDGTLRVEQFEVQPSFAGRLERYSRETSRSTEVKILTSAISGLVGTFVQNRNVDLPYFHIALPSGAIVRIDDWKMKPQTDNEMRVVVRRALDEQSPKQDAQDEDLRRAVWDATMEVRQQVWRMQSYPDGPPPLPTGSVAAQ